MWTLKDRLNIFIYILHYIDVYYFKATTLNQSEVRLATQAYLQFKLRQEFWQASNIKECIRTAEKISLFLDDLPEVPAFCCVRIAGTRERSSASKSPGRSHISIVSAQRHTEGQWRVYR